MTTHGSEVPATAGTAAEPEPEEPLSTFGVWSRAALLGVDGFLVAIFAVFFLPQWIGSIPVPISGLLAGVANVGLVVLAIRLLGRSFGIAPVAGFALGLLVCMLGGPGGDVLVPNDWRAFVLVFGGLLPPLAALLRARLRSTPPADVGAGASSG